MHLISPADSFLYWAAVTVFTFAIATGVLRRWSLGRPGVRRGAVFVAMFVASALVVGLLPSAVYSMARGPGGNRVTAQTAMWWSAGIVAGAIGLGVLARAIVGDPSRGRRRCAKCWYDLSATAGLKCPECGREARSERGLFRTRRRMRGFAAAAALLLVSAGTGLVPVFTQGNWQEWVPTTALVAVMPYLQDGQHSELVAELAVRSHRENEWLEGQDGAPRPRWWRRFAAGRCIAVIGKPNRSDATSAAVILSAALGEEGESVKRHVLSLWDSGSTGVDPLLLISYFHCYPDDLELMAVVAGLLDHADANLRYHALLALAESPHETLRFFLLPRLCDLAVSDQVLGIRNAAIWSLGVCPPSARSRQIVMSALDAPEPMTRLAALQAVTRFGPQSEASVAARLRALEDASDAVAGAAADIFGQYGPYDDATMYAVLGLVSRGPAGITMIENWLWYLQYSEADREIHAVELALEVPEARHAAIRAVLNFGERALPLLPRLERLEIEAGADPGAPAIWRSDLEVVLTALRQWAGQRAADEGAAGNSTGHESPAGLPRLDQ